MHSSCFCRKGTFAYDSSCGRKKMLVANALLPPLITNPSQYQVLNSRFFVPKSKTISIKSAALCDNIKYDCKQKQMYFKLITNPIQTMNSEQ